MDRPYQSLFYNGSARSFHFESDDYLGWIADSGSNTWFDLNNLVTDDIVALRFGSVWEFRIVTDEEEIEFSSVGEFLCVTGSFEVSIIPLEGLQVGECPDTTAGVLTLWLVVALGCALVWFSFVSKVGVFGFLGGLIIMIDSWYLAGCSSMIAFIVALVSFVVMLWFVLFFRPYGNQSEGILQ